MCRILTIIIIGFLSLYSSCNKRINCNTVIYSFETNIKAFPDLDSINIGDTIWLEYTCPKYLIDIFSNKSIDFSNAENLGTAINFYEFIGGNFSDPGVLAAVNAFDYKLVTGTFLPDNNLPEQNRDYRFADINGEYRFKLGIISKRKGIFSFSPGNASNVYTKTHPCDKANFSITFGNTKQHLYFYEQNRPGYIPSEYERTHMYCFKVK